MYKKQEIPISNGFYTLDSLPISHQKCSNWVPINTEQTSLSVRALLGTPGLEQVATTGSLPSDINRGAWVLDSIPYFVNGDSLYRLDYSIVSGSETWSTTSLGTISGSGRVSMADNGTQLMILVPGGSGYIYSVSGGLVEITDADFTANGNPQHVVFIDGYFACSTDSKKWIVSALNDGTTWDALDFSTAESDPDKIVAPVVYFNQIYLVGSETTETFQNIGGSGFLFQRGNQFFDKGCFSAFSLKNSNGRFFMIGGGRDESPAIWMFQGGSFQKISTIPIDEVLESYSDNALENAFSLAWGSKGQYFVSFTISNRTFVYNITTGLWHEQKSGIPNLDDDLIEGRWRVNSIVSAYGYLLAGDNQDGRIGKIDYDTYTEYTNNIVRVFSTQPLFNMGSSFRLPLIELITESGVGNDAVTEPEISMAISENNVSFGYERKRKIGAKGKYEQRTVWRKNGRLPRYGTLQFRLSDAVKPVVIKLIVGVS
jgi:hypothetical protein